MDYGFTTTVRPQSKPLVGRESEMKENLAGGYGFKADPVQAFKRWLLVGSMAGGYYQGRDEMTEANVATARAVMREYRGGRVADAIVNASKKGISVHTPIYALMLLSIEQPSAFREIFKDTIRTASHLYEFMSYVRPMRGFGTVIHKAVKDWLESMPVGKLEYQFVKYQNRYGWTGRDVLRMIKPKTKDEVRNEVYLWMTKGDEVRLSADHLVTVYEMLKSRGNETVAIEMIDKCNLTHEMIPANIERTPAVWDALYQRMPVGATIRNLGNLTDKQVFKTVSNIQLLAQRLIKDNLQKAYIHPVALASAQHIYEGGGAIGRSNLEWTAQPPVTDILEVAIENCFDAVKPTSLHFFHALDVSGSMYATPVNNIWLQAYQIAGIMALATIKSEQMYFVGGFDTQFKPLPIRRATTFQQISQRNSGIWPRDFGGTDASAAYLYAIKENIKTDVFVFWTDMESWEGGMHPSEALKEYRRKINPKAKAIYVTLVPYSDQITLVDPRDPMSYDIAGFTAETPKLMNMIARGEL